VDVACLGEPFLLHLDPRLVDRRQPRVEFVPEPDHRAPPREVDLAQIRDRVVKAVNSLRNAITFGQAARQIWRSDGGEGGLRGNVCRRRANATAQAPTGAHDGERGTIFNRPLLLSVDVLTDMSESSWRMRAGHEQGGNDGPPRPTEADG